MFSFSGMMAMGFLFPPKISMTVMNPSCQERKKRGPTKANIPHRAPSCRL